jgi:ribosome recycling factor
MTQVDNVKEKMNNTISVFENALNQIRTSGANPSLVANVEVDYYIDEHYVPNLFEYTVTNPSSVKLRVTAYYNGGTMTHNYVIATYETTD